MDQTLRQKILLEACHEAVRSYYYAKGFPDSSLDKVGSWYKNGLLRMITCLEMYPDLHTLDEDSLVEKIHKVWFDYMVEEGWSFGDYSEADKTHPNMKPTTLLSKIHKRELVVIVRAFKGMSSLLGLKNG